MLPRTLEQCLIETDPARVEAIAHQWDVDDLAGQDHAASALAAHILTPTALERAWQTLPLRERNGLKALKAAGGSIAWPSFTRRWGTVRAMGPGRMRRERPWEEPASPAENLWYRGLLFRAFAAGPTGLYEVAFIPDDLNELLPIDSLPSPLLLSPVPAPPTILPADDALLDDACTFLSYLQNHHVRPGPDGAWPAGEESRLLLRLRLPDRDRLSFLNHLAGRLGWLRTDRNHCLRPSPDPVTSWLRASAAEQRDVLARTWRDDPTWNDLLHVPTLVPEETGSWHNDPFLARQAILSHLDACQPETWYGLEQFSAAIQEADPDFQRPDGDYETWYIRDAVSGTYLRGFESWNAVEGALIRYLIAGPLAWLGLVELGAERPAPPGEQWRAGNFSAFRLTAAGTAFLAGELPGTERAEEPPPLTVRPDLEILVPAPRRYERFQLSRVADWVRPGDPYVYRLTPASLQRARRQKIPPERVTAFLTETTGKELPRALQAALARWVRNGQEVRLERGILLRVADESLLQELTTAPATRRLIKEVVGPTTALVRPADYPRLVRALAERGLLTDVVDVESPP